MKKVLMILSLILVGCLGYFFWYRFGNRDHLQNFAPEDTLAYFHLRKGSEAANILQQIFPAYENMFDASAAEQAIIFRKDSVEFLTYKDGKVHTSTGQEKRESTPFSVLKVYLGSGILQRNLGHFDLYGVMTGNFWQQYGELSAELPSVGFTDDKESGFVGVEGAIFLLASERDGLWKFQFRSKPYCASVNSQE